MAKRLEFSRKTKRIIYDRAAGRCEKCAAVLKTGEGEVDHILPCELGGEPTVANGRLLCRVCHKEKTAGDVRQIRESDRQRDKHSGVMRSKQTIHSRGFPKSAPKREPRPSLPARPLYRTNEEGSQP